MADPKSPKLESEPKEDPTKQNPSLVFVSHDSRDAALADAFCRLLKSVSAGMIKTFGPQTRVLRAAYLRAMNGTKP